MNVSPRIRTPGIILFLLFFLASCSILDPEDPKVIRITNQTPSAIHVQALELEASYTVDPAPYFTVDPSSHSVLLTGESLKLLPEDIDGPYEPGRDLALFIFEVQGSTATFRTVQQVLAKTIRNRKGRILITDL